MKERVTRLAKTVKTMKGKIKKSLKIILEVIAGILLLFFLAMFVMAKASGGPVFIFGKTTMWILTGSMDPTIPPKTYILVEKASGDEVKEDDIVVFISTDPRIEGQYNTHRIISIDGDKITTKGDGNPADDGPYSAKKENIVGRYVKTLHVMTFFGRIVLSPIGFAIMIVLFLLTTAIAIVPSVKDAVKGKSDEEIKKEEMDRRVREELEKLEKSGISAEELTNASASESDDKEKNSK